MALKKLKKLYKDEKTKTTTTTTSSLDRMTRQASNLKTRLEASGVSTDTRNALQKALNLREGSGFLEGLGDVLERGSGLASIKAMLVGDPLKSAGQNALDAFLGKQRYTGVDVVKSLNPDFEYASGLSKFLGGMTADIFLDPATYLSLGASALAKTATKSGAKALGYADDVADAVKGLNLQDLTKVLKTTKTTDQALGLVDNLDTAQDLVSASKLYRTADTLDTIANPLKLVPQGIKKLGGGAMKVGDKLVPDLTTTIRNLGDEVTKTFRYDKFLKNNMGEEIYKRMKNVESVSDASLEATTALAAEQEKLFEQMLKNIKKDIRRQWTITSKVDGSRLQTFSFKGMTDDEILNKLREFAVNQVYFKRPTVIDTDTINNLIRNRGRVALPVQEFVNDEDRLSLIRTLKALVDDPDMVSIARHTQRDTGKEVGWVINIGEQNAKTLSKNIDEIDFNFSAQRAYVQKKAEQKSKTLDKYAGLENKRVEALKKVNDLDAERYAAAKPIYAKLKKNSERTMPIQKQVWQMEELYGEGLSYKRHKDVWEKNLSQLDETTRTEVLANYKKLTNKLEKLEAEHQAISDELFKTLTPYDNEITRLKRSAGTYKANMARMAKTTIPKKEKALEDALEGIKEIKTRKDLVEDLYRTRNLKPFEQGIIDIPEMERVAEIQKQLTDTNLGIRNLGGLDSISMDKYDQFIHRKLTDAGKQYIQAKGARRDPLLNHIITATDKMPAQSAITAIYGNYSPIEVNTMMGFDLFDNNITAANIDMVTSLNRRTYNSMLLKDLFTIDNTWVKDKAAIDSLTVQELYKEGYSKINGKDVVLKLRLNEILDPSDINKINKQIRGKTFLVSDEAIEMFDKNAKLYKQLDSEFYQQLNKYMKNWKGGNLLSVGYHLRNIVGAETNMALAGMSLDDVAKYTAQAGIDVNKYNTKLLPEFRKWLLDPNNANIVKTGTLDDIAKKFGNQVGFDDAKLFTEMLDAQMKGVWGGIVGQHDAVKRAVGEMPKTKVGRYLDQITDINYKLGATSDDIHRIASYRWAQNPKNYAKVAKVGAADALDFVHYAMFDYKSMSPTEQSYFTKLFPFYNFIKNNLIFQFKNMATNAQGYNTLSKAYKNLYSAQEIADDEVQQYIKDQLYIPIKQADGTIKVLKVSAPVQDATNLLQIKNLLGATNPIIQYIMDRAYEEDLYTGSELTSDRSRNTQELIDILPYGRTVRTLTGNPLSVLTPVSTTTTEKAKNQNVYQELLRLQDLQKQYRKDTGRTLPTLEELGLK